MEKKRHKKRKPIDMAYLFWAVIIIGCFVGIMIIIKMLIHIIGLLE